MSNDTPVAMPAPYGQTFYGMQDNDKLVYPKVNLGELAKEMTEETNVLVNLTRFMKAELNGETITKEFDWEAYFQKELVNDHRQVEVNWKRAAAKEYAEALAKLPCADDHDSVENPKHYVEHEIEPIEYIMKNHLDFAEGCVVKYISRHRLKNGAEDVKKAIKFCEFILKYTYHKD